VQPLSENTALPLNTTARYYTPRAADPASTTNPLSLYEYNYARKVPFTVLKSARPQRPSMSTGGGGITPILVPSPKYDHSRKTLFRADVL